MSDALRPGRDFRVKLWMLMFGCIAAPLFWLGQLLLAYWISAEVCYGGDHPTTTTMPGTVHTALIAFDVVAIIGALVGGVVALLAWLASQQDKPVNRPQAIHSGERRQHFMALWGIFSSLCFLIAIAFETIASITVPICTR